MGKLSTHVLDTTIGRPAQGVKIELYSLKDGARTLLTTITTNSDGRTDSPLLTGDEVVAGSYELVFHAGDYFAANGVQQPTPRFVDQVSIHFGMEANGSYHVPLVVTPWSWSTYRGS